MATPSYPGGSADKAGNQYEADWTVHSVLDLIAGDVEEIHFEPLGPDGLGVEFYRVLSDGSREFHTVKRSAPSPSNAWSPSRLTKQQAPNGRSTLGDLFAHLDRNSDARAVFISQDSARQMRELSERALAAPTYDRFLTNITQAERGIFNAKVVPLAHDAFDAYAKLRRCQFETRSHLGLTKDIENRISALIVRADGGDSDPSNLRRFFAEFAWQHLRSGPVRRIEVVAALNDRGFNVRLLVDNQPVMNRIGILNSAFHSKVARSLVNGSQLPRSQASSIADKLIADGESLLLGGGAGIGKSCVLAQIAKVLEGEKVPHLIVSMDTIEGVMSSIDLGRKLGLPTSPAIILGEMARNERAVFCIDQLDALSFVGGRNAQGHQVLEELIEEIKGYPNLRLLLSCRSFDLNNDSVLRGLVEGRSPIASRVEVERLSLEDVADALTAAGVEISSLLDSHIDLLRTPLHLYLYLEGGRSSSSVSSRRELFESYWDEKRRRVDQEVEPGAFSVAVQKLSEILSDRKQLQVPRLAIVDLEAAIDAMGSEGTLIVDGSNVSFFHATFFDYAFAKGFVGRGLDLVEWLIQDSQEFFRRSQVRQVLGFLREGDSEAYFDVLGRLLDEYDVRFHLKRLVIDWLGELQDPGEREWRILEQLEGALSRHLLNAIYNKVPWFDLLDSLGKMGDWASSGMEGPQRQALIMSRGPEVLQTRSAIAAGYLRPLAEGNDWLRQAVASVMAFGDVHQSRPMFDLFLELLADGELEGVGGLGGPSEWWMILSKMSSENPAYCAEAIGHRLDRLMEMENSGESSTRDNRIWWSNYSEEVIARTASNAPAAFASQILPRVAQAASSSNTLEWDYPFTSVRQHIVEGLSAALIRLAREEPNTLDQLLTRASKDAPRVVEKLKLRAWAANLDNYGDRILTFLIDRKDLWDIEETRLALSAATQSGSSDLVARLEKLILEFRPEDESRLHFGRSQFRLLSSFAPDALSSKGSQRLGQLIRKFGEPPPPANGIVAKLEVQHDLRRIPDSAIEHMKDDQVLKAMQEIGTDSSRPFGNTNWDAVEFSRQLESRTGVEPQRFFKLVTERMQDDLSSKYFSHILDGLVRAWPENISTAELCSAISRLHELPGRPCGMSICSAVKQMANEELPDEILQAIVFYANDDPDPAPGTNMNYDFEEGGRSVAAITAGINSVRGVAIQAVAALLHADPNRSSSLMDVVKTAIQDPTLAVRSLVPLPLLAMFETNEENVGELFNSLCSESPTLLGTNFFVRYLHHASFISYESVRPILLKMVDSDDDSVRLAGARLICVAALIESESQDVAVADAGQVTNGSAALRRGAAEVYATNIKYTEVAQTCTEALKRFFDDPDPEVQMAAANFLGQLDDQQVSEENGLLEAFVSSKAFDTQAGMLLYRLKNMATPLPVIILSVAEQAVANWGPDASDISTSLAGNAYNLSELIVRLYAQTTDRPNKERILDVIDRMFELNFMGIAGSVAAEERV